MIGMKAVLRAALETAEARIAVTETNQIRHALAELKLRKKTKPNIRNKILTEAEVKHFIAELRKPKWGPDGTRSAWTWLTGAQYAPSVYSLTGGV